MSFSSEVKEELEKTIPSGKHCHLAELLALWRFGGKTETKYFTLCKKTFIVGTDIEKTLEEAEHTDFLKKSCCKRAYLRGAFLCAGSMSDPKKSYHLEFVCEKEEDALMLQSLIREFEIETRIIPRKKYHVLYSKEGSAIVDLLNIMGAHRSLLSLETLRVEKEMRNSINRKVNCETANITKTVTAAGRQIADIMLIEEKMGFSSLPEPLREIAKLRLQYPESPLQELGRYLSPPVGKSGVNHRLRKLSEIADKIRT